MLARPISVWRISRPGDRHASLATYWLLDAGRGRRGIWYHLRPYYYTVHSHTVHLLFFFRLRTSLRILCAPRVWCYRYNMVKVIVQTLCGLAAGLSATSVAGSVRADAAPLLIIVLQLGLVRLV